ncbi:MAG TPA: hypothetical protein VF405_16385 [Gammaproteobacteria bacterium]
MGAQLALEAFFGDALLLEEWLHGSRRTVADALVDGWVASIPWVLGFWAIAILLRAASGPRRRVELAALLVVAAALVTTILWFSLDVPLLLVLLLLCAALLECCRARGRTP